MWRALVLIAAATSLARAEGVQAGVAAPVRHLPPAPVDGLPPATAVATNSWTSCAIASGEIWCWGEMDIFGDGLADRDKPVKLDAPKRVRQLSLSETGACALDESGQVWCWGRGFDKRPRKILGNARKVSAGNSFACALRADARVVCWGDNYNGELGQGLKKPSPPKPLLFHGRKLRDLVQPVPMHPELVEPPPPWPKESRTPLVVPGADEIADLACGGTHVCAAKKSGRVICWGARDVEMPRPRGPLGADRDEDDGPDQITVVRTGERFDIPELDDAVALSASDRESCALRKNGELSCWNFYTLHTPIEGPHACAHVHGVTALGEHSWWAVIDGGQITRTVAGNCYDGKPESGISDLVQAGTHCGLRKDGVVICWGPNPHGELGRPAEPFYDERF